MSLEESKIKDIGRMRWRGTIKFPIDVEDSAGGDLSNAGTNYRTVSGELIYFSASEVMRRGRPEHFLIGEFITRYDLNVTTDMSISVDGYEWDIKGIKKLGSIDRYMTLSIETDETRKE